MSCKAWIQTDKSSGGVTIPGSVQKYHVQMALKDVV